MSKLGYPRISVSLQVDAKDTDDIRSIFLADTIRELQINTNSGAAAQLNFTFKGLYFSAAQLGTDGNVEVWNIESDEEASSRTAQRAADHRGHQQRRGVLLGRRAVSTW
jgi:hypothetical protein